MESSRQISIIMLARRRQRRCNHRARPSELSHTVVPFPPSSGAGCHAASKPWRPDRIALLHPWRCNLPLIYLIFNDYLPLDLTFVFDWNFLFDLLIHFFHIFASNSGNMGKSNC